MSEPMSDNRLKMQDPRHQYPQPPFQRQPQPAPGLAKTMVPPPDHGEQSYTGCGKLTHRKALITGGDSGIGRAVAIAFAREGADVAISYLPSEEADAQEVIALIEQSGRKAVALPGDISDEQVCRKLVTDAVAKLGGLDILINNAAMQETQPLLSDITSEQFDQVLKTNLYALFWITQEAVPHLKPGAAIINTASVQAYEPSQGLIDYALTKTGIVAFSKALSKQMIEQGVRVNVVAPGPFWTPLQPSGGQTQEKVEKFGESVPMQRPGQPVEVAPIYVLLASQEGSYITGEVYGITGGVGIA
jgi:NAD(P)-dependent dehydrogenase (short-subunit alcohol dehydrogenase family)